jgi:hypothetical protein
MLNCSLSKLVRKHDEVGEEESADEERRREEDVTEHGSLGVLAQSRGEETPHLPQDDRERQGETGPDADHDRGHERLGDAERGRPLVIRRKRRVQPVEDLVVEAERDPERDGQRDQADDQTTAQLTEVLDKRRLLPVREATR